MTHTKPTTALQLHALSDCSLPLQWQPWLPKQTQRCEDAPADLRDLTVTHALGDDRPLNSAERHVDLRLPLSSHGL